jgi:hypothetical protein
VAVAADRVAIIATTTTEAIFFRSAAGGAETPPAGLIVEPALRLAGTRPTR